MKAIEKTQKAKDDFNKAINDSNYKVLGEYLGTSKKIEVECTNNHKWSVTPSHFKSGVRCPYCQNLNKVQAKERFFKMIEEEGYACFSEYNGNKSKVELQCPKGHIYSVRPNDFMTGHRCRSCSMSGCSEIMGRKTKSFNELKEIANNRGFKILGEYINLNNKIKMSCPNGHMQMYNISHFKEGFGCPVCNGTDSEEAKKDLFNRVELENYKVLGEYINVMTKIDFQCPEGHIYQARPNDFKNGYRCTICGSKSFGEDVAKKILVEKNIKFETEKTFNDLIGLNGGKLRIDIYIPSVNVAIEIQGEQHFEYDEYLTHNVFEHDELKRKYCIENNIKLFEIEYFSKKLGINKAKENVVNTLNTILDTLFI